MTWKVRHFTAAFWHYLNQPLWDSEIPPVWQLDRFWYLYKLEYLETCWEKDVNSERHYTQ